MFIKKYGIEKMTFITLTDGAGNYPRGKIIGGSVTHIVMKNTIKQMFIRLVNQNLLIIIMKI